jgi:hypothetical protein
MVETKLLYLKRYSTNKNKNKMKKTIIILIAIALMYIQPNKVTGQTEFENVSTQKPHFTEILTEDEEKQGEWLNKISKIDSLENFYIELVSTKTKDDYYPNHICVQIFEKPSRRFVQEIDLSEYAYDCRPFVGSGDFNFDGWEDFSLFICSYAGPYISSLYFLYDPEKKEFFDSKFSGVSLEFDGSDQTIFERNQCCAGSRVNEAIYKVIDNKMVMIERHCFEADMKKLAKGKDKLDLHETDCEGNFLDIQLKSIGLKKNFQLKIAIFEDNLIGGNVLYSNQKERIPIRLDHEEGNYTKCFYNEIYNGEITGTYIINMIPDVGFNASYTRKKDNKTFQLEVINKE